MPRLALTFAKLKEEMQRLHGLKARMLAMPDQQISLTDPDSRSMATSGRGSGVVGYNVQVAVDTEHHLIITHEVTTASRLRDGTARIGLQSHPRHEHQGHPAAHGRDAGVENAQKMKAFLHPNRILTSLPGAVLHDQGNASLGPEFTRSPWQETPMPKQVLSPRNIVIAAVVGAALTMPATALADQPADAAMHAKKQTARIHHPQQRHSDIRPRVYNAAPEPPGCTWPYRNQFPPCQSTWPAGDPNYHGSRPGPTFGN